MRRRFMSIGFKIVSIILIVLVVSISASLLLTVRLARENLIGNLRTTLAVNNEILTAVIRSLMLSGEAPVAVKTLDSLRAIPEFKKIAVFRADGTAAFSDYRTLDFVNSYQEDHHFERTPRMESAFMDDEGFRQVLASNTPRQFEIPSERRMDFYSPILNFSQCRECHGDKPFIRGVAFYEVSTASAYDKINQTAFLIALVLAGMGAAIALLLIALMRRIVVDPILAIESSVTKVGEGDLEVRIDFDTRDEFEELGRRINGMIEGLQVRNRLAIENKTIEARNEENRKYLDNIGQGLLLIGKDRRIREQYSVFLVELFGQERPQGQDFVDFIYPDPALVEEREELARFVKYVFVNTTSDMEMIDSINPLRGKRLLMRSASGVTREIVVDASFVRIPEGDEVGSVMVIFDDLTSIVRAREELEVQRERTEAELEEIAAILKAGPEAFEDFLADSLRTLEGLRRGLSRLEDSEVVAASFRDLHSLKGAARYFEFKTLARHAHIVENVLAAIRDSGPSPKTREELDALSKQLIEEVENVRSVNERFKAFLPAREKRRREGMSGDLEEFLDQLKAMATGLAADLGKPILVETSSEIQAFPDLDALRNSVLQIVRNAVDHGIEDEIERVSEGKSDRGRVDIRFRVGKGGEILVEVEDDGRGLDFEAIRRRAIEKGLLRSDERADPGALVKLIFRSDFSSRDEVTEISGRGVGLDVVKDMVRRLGATISVRTERRKGTRFTIRVPRREGP